MFFYYRQLEINRALIRFLLMTTLEKLFVHSRKLWQGETDTTKNDYSLESLDRKNTVNIPFQFWLQIKAEWCRSRKLMCFFHDFSRKFHKMLNQILCWKSLQEFMYWLFNGLLMEINHPKLNLFGLDWIELFELWSQLLSAICRKVQATQSLIQYYKEAFPNVFKDTLGHCKKTKVKLYLKQNARLVYKPKRPVPFTSITSKQLLTINTHLGRYQISKELNHSWTT